MVCLSGEQAYQTAFKDLVLSPQKHGLPKS